MFAALTASGYIGSSLKPPGDEVPTKPPKVTEPNITTSGSVQSSQRRRSQRLANQVPVASTTSAPFNNISETILSAGNAISSGAEPASSEIVDSELQAEFSEDENFDAEIFDDEIDPDNSISEKTITLSVAEGE